MSDDIRAETACNREVVYEPPTGWWCRDCGVFTEVDDDDVCADCRRRVTDSSVAQVTAHRGSQQDGAHRAQRD